MNTFIVPTDFSHNAKHASKYAVLLAKQLNAQIILLHIYEDPVSITEYSVSELHFDNMKPSIENQLNSRKQELEEECGLSVPIKTLTLNNGIISGIQKVHNESQAGLVVIGLTGSGMVNFFLGSNTLNIINNIGQIVLTVPPFTTFRPIKKIVFACDMQNVETTVPVEKIKRISNLLNAELLILNILKNTSNANAINSEKEKFNKMMTGLKYSFHTLTQNNIIDGIKNFALENQADLIAIVPHKRDFFENLLSPNHTKAILFKSTIPILTLPGKSSN